mmetsp:Transcript_13468/g.26455  ORF Transcript_13468/g.26455 Transcript_13468/m.26455 type:complete len:261 (-) Transcript_13468:71-853(-)
MAVVLSPGLPARMARARTAHSAASIATNDSLKKDLERRQLGISVQGSRCGLSHNFSVPSRRTHTAVFATASGAFGTSECAASMHRSRSLPITECRPVEPQRRCLATPVSRKCPAPGSCGCNSSKTQQPLVASSSVPTTTRAAAAVAGTPAPAAIASAVGGLLGSQHRGVRGRTAAKLSKKLALPFAYPDEDPRHSHVELAESRSISETFPESVLPPLPSSGRPAQSFSSADWTTATRPACEFAAASPGKLPRYIEPDLGA